MDDIKSFINKVNSNCSDELPDVKNNFSESILKEINFNEVYSKLVSSKQDKIKVREIILESEIDFINSVKQLKGVFDLELAVAIDKVSEAYKVEILNLKSLYRNKFAGEGLMNLIKALNNSEYSLIMMNSRIYAYKYYEPYHDVTEGHYQSGVIHIYDEPVCSLKGIYVNLLHPAITNGTILISTDDRHPNANSKGLSEVCVGNLDSRAIPIDDTQALLALLDEICGTYEIMHLDSAYFVPQESYSTKEGTLKWTA